MNPKNGRNGRKCYLERQRQKEIGSWITIGAGMEANGQGTKHGSLENGMIGIYTHPGIAVDLYFSVLESRTCKIENEGNIGVWGKELQS